MCYFKIDFAKWEIGNFSGKSATLLTIKVYLDDIRSSSCMHFAYTTSITTMLLFWLD